MSSVYPKAAPVAAVPPAFNEALCATRLIALRDARPKITKVLAAGKLIHAVGGTVADIYRVWDEVEAERVKWCVVSPADFSTSSAFKSGLVAAEKKHLDETLWYDGLKAKHKVSTYAELKAAFTTKEVVG